MDGKTHCCQDISFFLHPNLIYKFNVIPSKIPVNYFVDIGKLILTFTRRNKRPRVVSTILKEKNRLGGSTLPDFTTYCRAALIKTASY